MQLKAGIRYLIGIIALILLLLMLWKVREIGIYFGISVVLALIGRPLINLINKFKIKEKSPPNWFSAFIVLATYIVAIVLIAGILIPVVSKQAAMISSLDVKILIDAFSTPIEWYENWVEKLHLEEFNQQYAEDKIVSYLDFSFMSGIVQRVMAGIGTLTIGVFSVLFITFFLLKDRNTVNLIVETVTPDKYIESIHHILKSTKDLLTRYFIGISIQVSIITLIVTVGLSIIGIPNALFIGIVAGLINVIPYVGPLIGGSFGIVIGTVSMLAMEPDVNIAWLVSKMLIVFTTAQMTDNFVLQPLIFSKSVKAHPLEIFLVIMISGTLFGILGMVLAIPIYTFLRIVGKEFFNGVKIVQGLTKNI
jgi:predicted PurR-regulated permease PerM